MGKQKSIFDIDWTNLTEVIEQCERLNAKAKPGFESSVIQIKGRSNYNITHTSQISRLHGSNATILHPGGINNKSHGKV